MPINNHINHSIKKPICVSLAIVLSGVAQAAGFIVTEPIDDGTGLMANTLSWAILQANTTPGNDHINLESDVSITGVMKRLVDSDVTISSDSTHRTISGNNQFRPLFIKSGQVLLSDFTLDQGLARGADVDVGQAGAGLGGALFVYDGEVVISEITISNSSAEGGSTLNGTTCYNSQTGGGMFGSGLFDLNGNYGGYGLYQTIDSNFGSAGAYGLNGGFGSGGGGGYAYFTSPGSGGFGGGGGCGEGYLGYYTVSGGGGFGSGGGYGGWRGDAAGMGGAVFIRGGQVRFEHTTITSNTADTSSDASGLGGGVFILHNNTNLGRGLPDELPQVGGCRMLFANNMSKSSDANGNNTDDIFDLSQLLNDELSYESSDPCLFISGNSQLIAQDDDTPNSSDGTHFGSIVQGVGADRVHVFEIQNTGPVDLQFNNPSVLVSGDHPSDFQVTNMPPVSVGPGEVGIFEVAFSPITVGHRKAEIEVQFNDGMMASQRFSVDGQGVFMEPEIEVRGNGQTILDGSEVFSLLDNTEFSLANVFDGLVEKEFELLNTGNDNLLLTGSPLISLSGPDASDFLLTEPPAGTTIDPNDESSFSIAFDPTLRGLKTAQVIVQNNDPDESDYQFSISGLAVGPKIVVRTFSNFSGYGVPPSDGATIDLFGLLINSQVSLTQEFRIQNLGEESDLMLNSNPMVVNLTNLDGALFSVEEGNPDVVLSPGEHPGYVFDLNFVVEPPVGIKQALLDISSNDPEYPHFEFIVQARAMAEGRVAFNNMTDVIEGNDAIISLIIDELVPYDQEVNYEISLDDSDITQSDLITPLSGVFNIPANTLTYQFIIETVDDDDIESSSECINCEWMRVEFESQSQFIRFRPNSSEYIKLLDNDADELFMNGFEPD